MSQDQEHVSRSSIYILFKSPRKRKDTRFGLTDKSSIFVVLCCVGCLDTETPAGRDTKHRSTSTRTSCDNWTNMHAKGQTRGDI